MALPANWSMIPVTGTYLRRDGSPASGYILFESTQTVVDGSNVVLPATIQFPLDATGSFSGTLPATDDPDITPTGWQYKVTEKITNGRAPFYIDVPYNSTGIDMASVSAATPVAPASVPPATSPLTGAETFVGTQSSKSVEITVDQIRSEAFVYASSFGMDPSLADNGPALLLAIQHIMGTQGSINAYGGTLLLDKPGTYTCTTNIGILPNDGSTTAPRQACLTIKGLGAGAQSYQPSIGVNPGTVLDLAYTIPATQNAKIDTRGSGVLTLEDINITDSGGSADPFLMTTNTIIKRKGTVAFIGTKTGTACDQDAIILGGTSTTIGNAQDAPFQGYGTVIDGMHFNGIRRAVYARVYANGVPIINNTVWANCGSSDTYGAPFEFDGDPLNNTASISGNVCKHNTVEVEHYNYGVVVNNAYVNSFANGLYDAPSSFVAGYYFGAKTGGNSVGDGFLTTGKTLVIDDSTGGLNQWTPAQQDGVGWKVANPVTFTSQSVVYKNGSNSGPITENVNGDQVYCTSAAAANKGFNFYAYPSGSSAELLATLLDYGSGTYVFTLNGTNSQLRAQSGTLTLETLGNEIDLNVNGTRIGYLLKTYADWSVPHHGLASNSGATASRPPATLTGQQYFDTTLGKPIWWNGTGWVDATGASA